MYSKVWLFNIVLAAFVLFFSYKTYDVWLHDDSMIIKTDKAGILKTEPKKKLVQKKVPSKSSCRNIVERNLFSPDRTFAIINEDEEIVPVTDDLDVKQLKIPGKNTVLHGVIIKDDYRSAFIKNPFIKPGEKQDCWVREGDTIDQFTITHIEPERILLTKAGGKQFYVLLYDGNKPKMRAPIKKRSGPTVVAVKPTPKPRSKPKSTPKPGKKSMSRRLPGKGFKSTGRQQTNDGKFEIKQTPFGPVKKRIK